MSSRSPAPAWGMVLALRRPGPPHRKMAPALGWALPPGRTLVMFLLLRPHFPSVLLAASPPPGLDLSCGGYSCLKTTLSDRGPRHGVRHPVQCPGGKEGLRRACSHGGPGDIHPSTGCGVGTLCCPRWRARYSDQGPGFQCLATVTWLWQWGPDCSRAGETQPQTRRPRTLAVPLGPGEQPCSVTTDESVTGPGTRLWSVRKHVACSVVFRRVSHGLHTRSSLGRRRARRAPGLQPAFPQTSVLSFPAMEWGPARPLRTPKLETFEAVVRLCPKSDTKPALHHFPSQCHTLGAPSTSNRAACRGHHHRPSPSS